ncbi:RimK family alpha-L-glutamate ligase [Streptomyces sp. NPDC014892]|uniref:ATP-grasp domain-containing protein n=1 Tax=Streptomyces sp. NPDC014892 TaxID=3364930 RepID=UPI0036F78082
MNRVVILTDARYLAQRMPGALVDALRGRDAPAVLAPADRLVAEVGADEDPAPGRVATRRALLALRPGDLVVPRTRNAFALSLLLRAELSGVRTVNRWEAVQAVRDKPYTVQLLARAGVPTPVTFLADRPDSLADLPDTAWPLLLKPPYGDNGLGIVRVDSPGELRRLPWSEGMVLAQHYVDVAGVDVKLYGAGDVVWAVRRPSPLLPSAERSEPVPLPVTDELRTLALACRDASGLELYGVDVLPSPDGPLVVDVNDFPNYTGIAEAPDAVADLVESRLTEVVPL